MLLVGAAAASQPFIEPEVGSATIGAIEFCATEAQQSKITIPAGYVMYQKASGALAVFLTSKHIPTMASAPPLVQRFAASSSAARFGSVISFIKVRAKGGDVWIVLGDGPMYPCDVFVTGVEKIADTQAEVLAGIDSAPKWSLIYASKATEQTPLAAAVYSQSVPKPGKPNYGLKLKLQALRPDLAKSDGVQIEASVISGTLEISPSGIKISN